jgi:hypothetical protein
MSGRVLLALTLPWYLAAPASRADTTPPTTQVLDCENPPAGICYRLVRVPKAGGAPAILSAGHLIGHVFVDDRYVYWSEGEIGAWQLMRMDKLHGTFAEPMGRGAFRVSLLRAEHSTFGIFDEGLVELQDQKAARVLVPGERGGDVTMDEAHLYWLSYGAGNSLSVRRTARGASTPAPGTLANGGNAASYLALRDGQLYWANLERLSSGGHILRMPASGASEPVEVVATPSAPWALAVDDSHVYWSEWQAGGYAVARAPRQGGAPSPVSVAPARVMNRDNRDHVEVDGQFVYWNARVGVARAPKAGGPARNVLRLARGDVMSFATDAQYVYAAVVIFGDKE